MTPTVFPWRDGEGFAAFLAATPRALVLFAGDHCPYSATLRPHFEKAAGERVGGWTYAVRELSERDEAAWDAHGLRVTPTVVAFAYGREAARLEARMLLGVTRPAFLKWLRTRPGPS